MKRCIVTLLFILLLVGYHLFFNNDNPQVIANSITISELKDEIKKGREFYLDIDGDTLLKFNPYKSTWGIYEVKRKKNIKKEIND